MFRVLPPSLAASALPLLLPLLLEVLLAGRVRVGVRVPLHGLGLVACLLQLVLDEPGGAAPRGSRRELVRLCIQNTMYSPMCVHSAL